MEMFRYNFEGKIEAVYHPEYVSRFSIESRVSYMNKRQMMAILAECGGNFSKLEKDTAAVISMKAADLAEKAEKAAEVEAARRKETAKRFHEQIIEEIRQLAEDFKMEFFSPEDIQLAAVKQTYFPVRSYQLYAVHLDMEEHKEDSKVRNVYLKPQEIHYILKNKKPSSRTPAVKTYYKWTFIK